MTLSSILSALNIFGTQIKKASSVLSEDLILVKPVYFTFADITVNLGSVHLNFMGGWGLEYVFGPDFFVHLQCDPVFLFVY